MAGTLAAAALTRLPRAAPERTELSLAPSRTTIPFRVLRFPETETTPLTDVVAFGLVEGRLGLVRASGEAFCAASSDDPGPERDVAVLASVPAEWVSQSRAVQGYGTREDSARSCLLLDEHTDECGHEQRQVHTEFRYDHYADCRLADGTVQCRNGYLSGRVRRRPRPGPIALDERFRYVTVSPTGFCGVTARREVFCWGPDFTRVTGVNAAASLALRREIGCALEVGGAVRCWSFEEDGWSASRVEGLPPAVQIAANQTATCALDAAGVVRCWGAFGRAWPGHPRAYRARRPLDVALPEPAAQLLPTDGPVMCARLRSGERRCWGGRADAWSYERLEETLGDAIEPETWVEAAPAREADARLDGERVLVRDPQTPRGWSVMGDLPPVRALASRESTTCALTTRGVVWCWGDNAYGQLGLADATRPDVWTAVQVMRGAR